MAAQEVIKSELPARGAAAVTPSDSADLAYVTRGLFIGVGGNLAVIMADDAEASTVVVFKGLAAGQILPIAVRRVRNTSTTATDIVALW